MKTKSKEQVDKKKIKEKKLLQKFIKRKSKKALTSFSFGSFFILYILIPYFPLFFPVATGVTFILNPACNNAL